MKKRTENWEVMMRRDERPPIVVLCGSSRYCDLMAVCAWLFEREEGVITMGLHLLPGWYSDKPIASHLAELEGCADAMDLLHLSKIDLATEIFVVDFDLYIGKSTLREIAYAKSLGLNIRYYSSDHIGRLANSLLVNAINHGAFKDEEISVASE